MAVSVVFVSFCSSVLHIFEHKNDKSVEELVRVCTPDVEHETIEAEEELKGCEMSVRRWRDVHSDTAH